MTVIESSHELLEVVPGFVLFEGAGVGDEVEELTAKGELKYNI
jgi:hypothetical protein